MTVKRRNHGRNKHGRGHVKRVRCSATAKAIPKDKAIKRFVVRNIVDASALRDIKEASSYMNYQLPKLYVKQYYCIEAAVHQRIVSVRSKEDRRNRNPMWNVGIKCPYCDYRKTRYNSSTHNKIALGHDCGYLCKGSR